MSGPRTTPAQFDVVATTRRSWSREQKRAIVAEIDVATGASVSEVARRHGIHSSQLFRWRREFDAPPSAGETLPATTFVPLVLEPCSSRSEPQQSRSTPGMVNNSSIIEILIAQGRVLRVGSNVDTAALVRIIHALEGRR